MTVPLWNQLRQRKSTERLETLQCDAITHKPYLASVFIYTFNLKRREKVEPKTIPQPIY